MHNKLVSRREMLSTLGMGMAGLGLASTTHGANPMLSRHGHHRARAKSVIHIFLNGGLSHVDSFDPKPELEKWAGKTLPTDRQLKTERPTGAVLPSPFTFKRYGKSGLPISEIFSHMGKCADELCVIRSMQANVPNHEPSLLLMNCGESLLPRPAMGSWVTYGLGTENQNLPGFIALCPNGVPVAKTANWQSSFLPGVYQGVHVDTKHQDVAKLIANVRNPELSIKDQRRQLDLLQFLNEKHRQEREHDAAFDARMQSYELAYRMQAEVPDVLDLKGEDPKTLAAYGIGQGRSDAFGRKCLMARRLLEKGVRFVQIWSGNDNGFPRRNWDSHEDIARDHGPLAKGMAIGTAALIKDLKQRDMLKDTLILWTTEFGRMPSSQGSKGRDHNPFVFTNWLCGGGIKGGVTAGESDQWGFKPLDRDNPTQVYDIHATMLHLLGIDHKQLTVRNNGIDRRLTDVHGHLIDEIIA